MKKIIKILFALLLFSSYGFLFTLLNALGFLSNAKILLVLIGVLILIIFLLVLSFIFKKKVVKVISYLLLSGILLLNIFGSYYLKSTLSFIDNIGNKDEYDYYYVLSLKIIKKSHLI